MSFFATLMQRTIAVESKYKEHEDGYVMTDAELHQLNQSLGLKKDKTYRPYCVGKSCEMMPRMALTKKGFHCWSCGNVIDFNLRKIDNQPIQTCDE